MSDENKLRLWAIGVSGRRKPTDTNYPVGNYRANLSYHVASSNIVSAIRAAEQHFDETYQDVLVLSAHHKGSVDLVLEERVDTEDSDE